MPCTIKPEHGVRPRLLVELPSLLLDCSIVLPFAPPVLICPAFFAAASIPPILIFPSPPILIFPSPPIPVVPPRPILVVTPPPFVTLAVLVFATAPAHPAQQQRFQARRNQPSLVSG
jgi:hypothetical protein